jgi:hypothetical protein
MKRCNKQRLTRGDLEDRNDIATHQGMPTAPEMEEERNRFSARASGWNMALESSWFQPIETDFAFLALEL